MEDHEIMKIDKKYENSVNICLVSSDEYSTYVSVTLLSIIQNCNQTRLYDINILTTDMSERNQKILSTLVVGRPNLSLRFINIGEYVNDLKFYTWAHFTKFTYYRLLIPYIFREYEKIIYLDSDVIVNTDISALYDTDIQDKYAGVARDTHVVGVANKQCPYHDNYYEDELGINEPLDYFQAGVMLLNIAPILKDFPDLELLKIASSNTFRWLDQDLLNKYFQGNVHYISNYWNLMIFNNPAQVDEYYLEGERHLDYFTARENPGIIHYVARGMPCFNPWGDLFWYYWKYARESPYYELLLSTMMDQKIIKESERLISVLKTMDLKGSKKKKLFKH